MWPNVRPKVWAEEDEVIDVEAGESYNLVKWTINSADLVENKKYSFSLKLKLGGTLTPTTCLLWASS